MKKNIFLNGLEFSSKIYSKEIINLVIIRTLQIQQ